MRSSGCWVTAVSVRADDLGYVFEAYDNKHKRKVALKRIEKVGNSLSREYEILFDIKNCDHVVKILVLSISPGLLLLEEQCWQTHPEHRIRIHGGKPREYDPRESQEPAEFQ
jgi:chloramphenicol O-acetyltransferase